MRPTGTDGGEARSRSGEEPAEHVGAGPATSAAHAALASRQLSAEAESSRLHALLSSVLPYALILVVGLVVLLPQLGQFGFWDPWEPKYAESVREMIERDSYFVPYYRDEVRLTKPILVYWGILAGAALFGLNEFGARIGGVCLCIASMLGVYYAISILRGRRAGLLSALVLGTAPLFYLLGRQATPDVYLFTTLGSSLVFFCLAAFGPAQRRNLHFGISYVCFSLAVLAKGPVIAVPVFFTPLAILAVARLDFERLWQPRLRSETVRLLVTGVPAVVLLPIFSITAFWFGLSSQWWGYSDRSRGIARDIRQELFVLCQTYHLAELVLALFVVGAGWLIYQRLRNPVGASRIEIASAAGFALIATVTAVTAGSTVKILVAALVGGLVCVAVLLKGLWRLLTHAELKDDVRQYLKPVGQNVLLFLGIFVLVAGPWHAVIFFMERHGYFTDFILKHNLGRIGDEINSSGVTDFYLRTLIFGFFPWSCFIPVALVSLVRSWDRDRLGRYAVEIYLLVSTVVIFVAFSSSVTKFSYYLGPILIPMSVLIGLVLDRMLGGKDGFTTRLAWIAALMLYLPPMLDLLDPENIKYFVGAFTVKRTVPESVEPGLYFAVLILAVALVLCLLVLVHSRLLMAGLVVCAVLLASYSTATFIPDLTRYKTMKNLVESWERQRVADQPLGFYGSLKHGVFFYTQNTVRLIPSERQFLRAADPELGVFIIVDTRKLQKLEPRYARMYPDHELIVVDGSHLSHALVTSRPVGDP